MELSKTVIRAIESRQKKFNNKWGGEVSVFNLYSEMEELLNKKIITVGGRQTCSKTDPTWDFFFYWNQVVNIFNTYNKDVQIVSEYKHIERPGGAFSGGYWTEKIYKLVEK